MTDSTSIFSRKDVIAACLETFKKHPDCLSPEHIAAEFALNGAMSSGHHEQLSQLVRNGPVWDGDVISKSARNDLMDWGLASRAVFKGESGYTVANYHGLAVCNAERLNG